MTKKTRKHKNTKTKKHRFVFVFSCFCASKKNGFSLVELILAIALFSLLATALTGLLWGSYGSDLQAADKDKASLYAQQGLEAINSIRRQAWNLLENGEHGLDNSGDYWQFSGSSDLLEDRYTRVVTIADVCRDDTSNIADCATLGVTVDLHTKKVVSKVTYTTITGFGNEVELTSYLTTWQSKNWLQTDWSGGPGQSVWSSINRYFTDDGNIDYSLAGEVKLKEFGGGGCGTKIWPFSTPTDYTYDPVKIEVTGSFAQLKEVAGSPTSGQTTNLGFDSGLSPWTFGRWGTVNPTGSWSSTGGNPDGYAQIAFPNTRRRVAGAYFQQSFTIDAQSITSATLNLDWNISQYTRAADSLILYAFVDTAAGQPTIGQEVWNSGNQTGITPWTSVTNLDVSSKITGPGTYYLKVVAYVDYPSFNARYTVGFDNVLLTWDGTSGISYPSDQPDIYPVASFTVSQIDAWSSFTEVATKNGGEIYYQLSDGTTWYWYNGSSWVFANTNPGTTDYNLASVISANISSFPIINQEIKFKAFFISNGLQQVQLDEVRIGCSQYYDWPFSVAADYTYDTNKIEVTGGVAQLKGAAFCSGTETPCGSFTSQTSCQNQSGCSWDQPPATCQNNGSCSALSRNQCNTCSLAGCSRSGNRCTGTLNCSAYTSQSACGGCNQCLWNQPPGSCSGTPTLCGDFTDPTSCQNQNGCSWTGSYPTNGDIQPTDHYNTPNVWEYTSFSEAATKNGGEIYYQFFINDVPDRWYWWNGSKWVEATLAGQYNTADVVNANVMLFPTSTSQIKFKAFLIGDGTQQVQLSNIRIGWGETAGASGYALSGWLESSAFNTGNPSAFNFLSWSETLPSTVEDIKVQLATAPNSSGPWLWQGPDGTASTYYQSGEETLIPLANGHNDNQWVKYKIFLSGDGSDTPIFQEIKINYTP